MTSPTFTRHVLPGLRPQPLASYLAGLGLIRVIGEQANDAATAAWTPDGLVIATTVPDIAAWLAVEYVPTPVLSPWNNGSGFGLKDKEPLRALTTLRQHPSPRLAPFRDAIGVAEQVIREARTAGWITDEGSGEGKGRLVQEFRNRCPDALLPWIDAAVVLAGDDIFFPPLLGTGGNDGRLDFSTNFHQRLLDVMGTSEQARARSAAMARDLVAGTEAEPLSNGAVGQFDPAGAGGPGSSRFGAAASLTNPWGYILFVEGALLFAASSARRHQHAVGRAAMPFTVQASPDGSTSGAVDEESRGEVWAPVWTRPFTLAEIKQMFAEARASWRGRPARRAVDFYAATRTLGVARGISEFTRYGLQRRNGLAFAAVPLARVDVREHSEVRLAADVEDWASRFAGSDRSGAVGQAARSFEKAHMDYARDGGALPLARMLAALTGLEQAVGRSGRVRDAYPVRYAPSARRFLDVLRQAETPELRLAVGLASCATLPGPDQVPAPSRTLRQILLPIEPPVPGDRSQPNGRWRDAPLVPGFGSRELSQVLADVLIWRCRTAAAERGEEKFRGVTTFRLGIPVPAADLHALASGELDEQAIVLFLRACLALSWRNVRHDWAQAQPDIPLVTLGLLHPLAVGITPEARDSDEPELALNPDWAARLAAGQVRIVHQEAAARLRQVGWDAVPVPPAESAGNGVRIAAAMLPRCLRPRSVLSGIAIRIKSLESGELS
ncbi:MAG: type I-G CRISPR-associated protein Cas8g1/Csx17 [Streptosporangiaceae bacterium]